MGIVFGIIAMIGWGTADFFVAKAVRKTNVFKTFLWSQIIGMVLFLFMLPFFFKVPIFSFNTIIIILVTGFLGVVSYLAFYKGLQVGKVSIISPISACWVIVAVILSLIFLNEKLTTLQTIGVSSAILGTIFTSFKLRDLFKLRLKNSLTGIKYAIITLLGWGIEFLFISILVSRLSWFLPILLIKAVGIFYLLTYSSVRKQNISFPKNVALLLVLIGVLEVVAFLSYSIGVNSEYTAIVAPIVATFPMVTIILARIFFKESLEINQKIGIVFILIGLVILAL